MHEGSSKTEIELLGDVWKKSHEARTLDSGLHRALLLGGKARALAAHNAPVWIDELSQEISVFVIHVPYVVLSKNVCHVIFCILCL